MNKIKNLKNTKYAPFVDIVKYTMVVGSAILIGDILVNHFDKKDK